MKVHIEPSYGLRTGLASLCAVALAFLSITAWAQEDAGQPAKPPQTILSFEEIQERWAPLPMSQVQTAAEKGDPTAQHYLGRFHFDGLGGVTNLAEGLRWYRMAAEQNFPHAQNNLAVAYLHGRGVPADPVEARRLFRLAADQNFPQAQQNLSILLENAQGGPRDLNEARALLERAARSGHAESMWELGKFLMYRKGGALETDNALFWFRKAVKAGHYAACGSLGWAYYAGRAGGQDFEESLYWFRMGAEHGDAASELGIGTMHLHGKNLPQDDAQAEQWFRKAAERNYAPAQRILGDFFEKRGNTPETGRQPDYAAAALWYRKAANQGDALAQVNMARFILQGHLKEKTSEAIDWLRRAADKNDITAILSLAHSYRRGMGTPRNADDQPMALYHKLARYGYAAGFRNLSHLYRAGHGVPRDLILASLFQMEADERGDGHEPEAVVPEDFTNTAARADLAKARNLYTRAIGGDGKAQVEIASGYLDGTNSPRSDLEAYLWFSVAAEGGETGASAQVDRLKGRLTETELGEASWRLSWLRRQISLARESQ